MSGSVIKAHLHAYEEAKTANGGGNLTEESN